MRLLSLLREKNPAASRLACAFWIACFCLATCALYWPWLRDGRVWAEEGIPILRAYSGLYEHAGLLKILALPGTGYLQLGNNITIVFMRLLVPLEWAPLFLQLYALFFQSLPLLLLLLYRSELALRPLDFMLAGLILLFSVQQHEIVLSTTGLQFILSLAAAIVLILPATADWRGAVAGLTLALAVLTGVPSLCLLPLFGIVWLRQRSATRFVQCLLLAVCAVIQLSYIRSIGFSSGGMRQFGLGVDAQASILLYKWFLLPWFYLSDDPAAWAAGIRGLYSWKRRLLGDTLSGPNRAAIYLGLCAGFALLAYLISGRHRVRCWLLVGAALVISLVSIAGSLEGIGLLSHHGGGRYFYAPGILVFLAILLAARGASGSLRSKLAYAMLLAGLGVGALVMVKTEREDRITPWRPQVEALHSDASGPLRISPPGWEIWLGERLERPIGRDDPPLDQVALSAGDKLVQRFVARAPQLSRIALRIGESGSSAHSIPWKLVDTSERTVIASGEVVIQAGRASQLLEMRIPSSVASKTFDIELTIPATASGISVLVPRHPRPENSQLIGAARVPYVELFFRSTEGFIGYRH